MRRTGTGTGDGDGGVARIWRWLGQHRSVPVEGGEQAARQRFGFLRVGPLRFFFWSEGGSPVGCPLSTVHCPLPASDQARHERTRTPTSSRRSGIRLELGTAGYDQWRGAAVGMALATRYFGVAWRCRVAVEVVDETDGGGRAIGDAMRRGLSCPELAAGASCWAVALPRRLHLIQLDAATTCWKRCRPGAAATGVAGGGRGAGRWGHGSPAQRSGWRTSRRTFRAKRAKGQKGLSRFHLCLSAGCVVQTLPLPRPPLPEPIPDGQALDDTTPAECGMPVGWWFAKGRLFCSSCAVPFLLRRSLRRGPGPAVPCPSLCAGNIGLLLRRYKWTVTMARLCPVSTSQGPSRPAE